VRTYVRCEGKPGVFFFSLDATDALAVAAARLTFHLPYFKARMSVETHRDGWINYRSVRTDPRLGAGDFVGRYRPVGKQLDVVPGSLKHWLVERYHLYAVDGRAGRIAARSTMFHGRFLLPRPRSRGIPSSTVMG